MEAEGSQGDNLQQEGGGQEQPLEQEVVQGRLAPVGRNPGVLPGKQHADEGGGLLLPDLPAPVESGPVEQEADESEGGVGDQVQGDGEAGGQVLAGAAQTLVQELKFARFRAKVDPMVPGV